MVRSLRRNRAGLFSSHTLKSCLCALQQIHKRLAILLSGVKRLRPFHTSAVYGFSIPMVLKGIRLYK